MDVAILLVVAGAFLSGFVTGLAGFGVGLTALGFWLHVMEPIVAGPLVAICSVIGQLRSIVHVRREVSISRVAPFVVGGVIGLPMGVYLLSHISGQDLKLALGTFLVAYSIFGLTVKLGLVGRRQHRNRRRHTWRDRRTIRTLGNYLVWVARMDEGSAAGNLPVL